LLHSNGKVLIEKCKLNIVSSYEFLSDLKRLTAAWEKFRQKELILNAAIICVLMYSVWLLIGIIAVFNFYLQGSVFSVLPIILCAILGLAAAVWLRSRQRGNVFQLLAPSLSEKAMAAYDNRDSEGVIMRALAKEMLAALSRIKESDILDNKLLYKRIGAIAALLLIVSLMGGSGIGRDPPIGQIKAIEDIRAGIDEAISKNEESSAKNGTKDSIFGKPSLAPLAPSSMQIQIDPGYGTGSRPKETEKEERLFQIAPPGQGVAVESELYIESLPEGHKEIIKKYFENLAKGRSR
jgi:hypothetical protein